MFIRKASDRQPADVSQSWNRLKNWFDVNLPEVVTTLRPGCSPAELVAFEQETRLSLPEDVRQSFLIHDGQKDYTSPGVIVGQALDRLERVKGSLLFWREM